MRITRSSIAVTAAALLGLGLIGPPSGPAAADGSAEVGTSAEFIAAFEDGTTDQIVVTADIVLAAEPHRPAGADPLVVDGGFHRLTAAAGSAALAAGGATSDLTVRKLTIADAEQSAIRWINGSVTVEDAELDANSTASAGGAIFANGAPRVTLVRSTFTGNTAGEAGGAVWTTGDVEVTESSFEGNRAIVGGAISTSRGTGVVDITTSEFRGNEATGSDGGAVQGDALVVAAGSSFSDNTASAHGGAVFGATGVAITDSSAVGNEADLGGAFGSYQNVQLYNSTVVGNRAGGAGGAIFASGDVTTGYATITGNQSELGANLYLQGDTLSTFGTVVAEPGVGANCAGVGTVDDDGYSVEGGGDSCGFDAATSKVGQDEVGLGELTLGNGLASGRIPTAGGLLADAISSTACQGVPGVDLGQDQWQLPRPQGGGCDIGAIERRVDDTGTTTTTSTPTSTAGPADLDDAPPAAPVSGSATYTG